MLQLIPSLPSTLPTDKPVEIMWAPQGAKSGARMSATITPRGAGHMLTYHIGIRRTYANGTAIAGTAGRTDLRIMCAAVPGKGWVAEIKGEYTQPLQIKGEGDLASALAAIEGEIVGYAKRLYPLTLAGATAIPAALHAPSGGELLAL